MKKIRCIETSGYKLTEGKEYDLLKSEGGFHFLVNDNGKTVRYSDEFFEEVDEEILNPIMEIPLPPPPPARTEQDLINSIAVHGNNITFIDFNNNIKTIWKAINSENRMQASCGIGDVTGILPTIENIDRIVDDLNHNDDLITLRKALFKKSLQEYIIDNPDSDRGAYIVSCNTNDTDEGEDYLTEDYEQVLSSLAGYESQEFENPNSGNDIKFWVFYID